MFSLVPLSKSKIFTRVAPESLVWHSYYNIHVALVSDSCLFRVTLVSRWHSCCKIVQIISLLPSNFFASLSIPYDWVFVFPGPRPSAWPLALALSLYLPTLAPNLYLMVLPQICIYRPWLQICIYRPWSVRSLGLRIPTLSHPPIFVYRAWPTICSSSSNFFGLQSWPKYFRQTVVFL